MRQETPFERSRHLRHVPAIEGDLSTRRHWVIVHEAGRIPEKKGPFKFAQVDDFLQELVACRPADAKFTVVSLTWDFDVWIEDGRDRLAQNAILDAVDWDEVKASLAQ